MGRSSELRRLLNSGETLVMPDAYDPVSARIIEQVGFQAVQCSGYSMALAQCCPAEAEFGLHRNVAITRAICAAVDVPVMADAEDGFADAAGIGETVRAYLEAGVAGMNIEDQVLGAPGPKQLLPREGAVAKIQAARQAATALGDPDLILNARTDALAVAEEHGGGLGEAIERGNRYLQAGADLVFVVGVSTLDQVKTLVDGLSGPLSIAAGMPNNLESFSITQLCECGVTRVSLPSLALFAALQAVWEIMASVRETEGFEQIVQGGRTWAMADIGRLGDLRRGG